MNTLRCSSWAWLSNKVYAAEARLSRHVWARGEGHVLLAAAPAPLVYPLQGFPCRDEQWGSSAGQFQRAGVSAVSSALWRVAGRPGLQAGRNSKELGAVAGLCGDVFDYMQLAPLHQGTNHHRLDKTQASPPRQASLSD